MNKKVLIIDDEADVRTYLTTLLKKHGFHTVTAENGQVGLDMARQEKPDLITLDLMMPNQSGTDFYRNMIKEDDLEATPVIVVSGLAGRHLAVRKPAAVFDKPIDPVLFMEAVNKALSA